MKKVIGLVSLVVLSLSTISCSKDEDPFDYSCVDLDAAELYKSGFPEDYDDVVGQNMVLHLIADDVYISIKLTSWATGRAGGFAYERSTSN